MSSNISVLLQIPRTDFHIPEEKMEPNLQKDILNFLRTHPIMTAVEAAQAFRTKYLGYKASYTEDALVEDFKICMK